MSQAIAKSADAKSTEGSVSDYKRLLKVVLDNRPSGTRGRLAVALGKNRSFISQIANPAYPVPIPAPHIEAIFEICHFSQADQRQFLAAYRRAHPGRRVLIRAAPHTRSVTITVPDLGDVRKNRMVDTLIADVARRLARLAEDLAS